MTNFDTAAQGSVRNGDTKNALYQFPGRGMPAESEPESLSEDFNLALEAWIGRNTELDGSYIGDSVFAAGDRVMQPSFSERRKRVSGKIGKTLCRGWRQAGFFDLQE